MARLNISLCMLCASLSYIASGPLPAGMKLFPDGKNIKSHGKYHTPIDSMHKLPNGNGGLKFPFEKKSTPELPIGDTEDSGSDEIGSGADHSMTDSILDQFSINGSINYDDMDLAKSKPLVNTAAMPSARLTELSFAEMHKRAQFMRISEVKESILSKLRLLAPPNITALKLNNKLKKYPEHIVPKLPDHQNDFQKDDSHYNEDNFHAKINTVIQFASDFPANKHPEMYPVDTVAYFILPLTVSEKNIQKATLMVYIATPRGHRGTKVRLCISDTLHESKPFVNRTVILSSRGHWEHIDVSQAVIGWAADDSTNYGFIVTAMLGGKNIVYLNEDPIEVKKQRVVIEGDITTRPHRTPLIKIILNEQQGRYKRSFDEVPLSCDISSRDNRCCRYKFAIDFQEIGSDFDFIIQPRRYLANYCAGTCPIYYLPTDGNGKMLMGLGQPKVQRCCTAMTKKPLSVLYYDEKGTMMVGEIPDMSIEKCYCS